MAKEILIKGEENIRSEEVQEILTLPPSWLLRWGLTLILIFLIIGFLFTFYISYPDHLNARVIITTKRATEKVIARRSGLIDEIFVNNRDTVKTGQKVGVIQSTAKYKDVFYLKELLVTVDIEKHPESFPVNETSQLQLGEIEDAYFQFERDLFKIYLLKNLQPYSNEIRTGKESLIEIRKQLDHQNEQKGLLEQEIQIQKKEFSRYKTLHEKGIVSDRELEIHELNMLQVLKNRTDMAISISQLKKTLLAGDNSLRNTALDKQEENLQATNNLIQSYYGLKKAIKDWEYNNILFSSTTGIISFQSFWGANQNIDFEEVIFTILPINNPELMGKLTIPSINSGKAKIGQRVLIKLDNYNFRQYGMLIGRVEDISVSPDKDGNYYLSISLPKGMATTYGKYLPFNQELIGSAEIITEELSIAERIFYRFRPLFSN